MPRGIDTGGSPRRVAGNWRPVSGWTGPNGAVVSRTSAGGPYGGGEVVRKNDDSGYVANLTHNVGATNQGLWNERYVAGPYRTQQRAEIAGSALANRVDKGKGTEDYYAGDDFISTEDLRNDG